MPRLPIHHITLTYAGRELLAPGAGICLEEAELSLPWSYGTDTVGMVGRARAMVVDNGNATGSLTLPIVQDFPSIEAAMAALIEQQNWADAHTTGELSLALLRPGPPVEEGEEEEEEEEEEAAPPAGEELLSYAYPASDGAQVYTTQWHEVTCDVYAPKPESYYWAHIAAPPVPPGMELGSVWLKVRGDTGVCDNEADAAGADYYLTLWEQQANGDWAPLGVSAAKGEVGEPVDSETGRYAYTRWEFSPPLQLSGRAIRYHYNTEPTTDWREDIEIRSYVYNRWDDSSINKGGWSEAYIPDMLLCAESSAGAEGCTALPLFPGHVADGGHWEFGRQYAAAVAISDLPKMRGRKLSGIILAPGDEALEGESVLGVLALSGTKWGGDDYQATVIQPDWHCDYDFADHTGFDACIAYILDNLVVCDAALEGPLAGAGVLSSSRATWGRFITPSGMASGLKLEVPLDVSEARSLLIVSLRISSVGDGKSKIEFSTTVPIFAYMCDNCFVWKDYDIWARTYWLGSSDNFKTGYLQPNTIVGSALVYAPEEVPEAPAPPEEVPGEEEEPQSLTYTAALRTLSPRLVPFHRGYRLTTEWEWALV